MDAGDNGSATEVRGVKSICIRMGWFPTNSNPQAAGTGRFTLRRASDSTSKTGRRRHQPRYAPSSRDGARQSINLVNPQTNLSTNSSYELTLKLTDNRSRDTKLSYFITQELERCIDIIVFLLVDIN